MALPVLPLFGSLGTFFVTTWLSIKGWFVWLFGIYLVGRVLKVLVFLGIGVATYQLGSYSLDSIFSYIVDSLDGLGAMTVGMLHKMGVFEALSILFGAMSARLTIAGLTASGSVRR